MKNSYLKNLTPFMLNFKTITFLLSCCFIVQFGYLQLNDSVEMINQASKVGIYEILSTFDDSNLFSLAATVTQGLLRNKIENREEAISAIINYSQDVVSILRRKMITREVLFNYLHKKNITINLPATKNDLIDKISKSWDFQYVPEEMEQSFSISQEAISDNNTTKLLAEQFSQWFYSIMNQNVCIGSEHFYPDAKLRLNMITNSGETKCDYIENDPLQIVQHLFSIKSQHNLYFNPNLTEQGVQGRIDSYGLVLVLACGTIHCNNICVGVFEQVFALARDPSAENNWKIKSTELSLRSRNGIFGPPCLTDSELTSNLLLLPPI